jgi:hypothetical protein
MSGFLEKHLATVTKETDKAVIKAVVSIFGLSGWLDFLNASKAVADRPLREKAARVFVALAGSVTNEELSSFASTLSEEEKKFLQDNFLVMLDQLNQLEKSEAFSALLSARIKGLIDSYMFRKMIAALQALQLDDLDFLVRSYRGELSDPTPEDTRRYNMLIYHFQSVSIVGLLFSRPPGGNKYPTPTDEKTGIGLPLLRILGKWDLPPVTES